MKKGDRESGITPTRRLVLTAAGMALLRRVARAQPVQRHRIATLSEGSRAGSAAWDGFWQGLRALGYDDQELAIESRWADGHQERLPELAVELVRLAPEVIIVGSGSAALAVKQATSTIPIVVTALSDPIEVRAADQIDGAFSAMAREHADALVAFGGPLLMYQRSRIAELAASHKLPAIYYGRELAMAGGLMSYGADLKDMNRRAAIYVDKILKGAKPADLPVEQPTKFELVVNLKTAAALGLTIPASILARADEVIE